MSTPRNWYGMSGIATKGFTVLTNAVAVPVADFGFTAAEVNAAHKAIITAGSSALRVTYDGTAPTAAIGRYVPALGELIVWGNINVRRLQTIGVGASSGASISLEGGTGN